MFARVRSFVVVLLAATLVASTVACESGGPAAPTPVPPPTGPAPILAPPPPGVSPGVWRIAFSSDGKLRRPDAVHLVLPDDMSVAARNTFTAVVNAINGWGLQTRIDFTADTIGANFFVSIVPGLLCNGALTAGCTSQNFDSAGRITGGTMKFEDVAFARQFGAVMHEVIWTLGPGSTSPVPGIMYRSPSGSGPTPEELKMLQGRDVLPLLSVYASGQQ